MHYYGVDFHKDYSFITHTDANGNIIEEMTIRNTPKKLKEFVNSLEKRSKLALEAVGNWYYFYELLEKRDINVYLCHPKKTKAIASARIKTDKIDARTIAHLLRARLLPLSYIPPKDIRDTRELIRYRSGLVKERTVIKNKIHSVLLKNGCPISRAWSSKNREKIFALKLRECFMIELRGYFRLLDQFNVEIKEMDRIIRELAVNHPLTQLLMTMPGIGYLGAVLIYAEIGDIKRFPTAGHLCSFAGLVPSLHSSGGKTRYGHITKEGSKYLRWILIENSKHMAEGSVRFHSLFTRVAGRHGKPTAKVAVAREALRVIYYMLKNKEPFRGAIKKDLLHPVISSGS